MDDEASLCDPGFDRDAAHAARELHYGRLAWLALHIRRSDFRIHPIVAKQLLSLVEGSDPNCYFEIRVVRRSDLPPAFRDPQLLDFRNFEMAVQVARLCKFKRGHILRACKEAGEPHGLEPAYVRNCIAPYRVKALEVVEEEELQAAYERGEMDFLGRPKTE